MARKIRIECAGAAYHIMVRGNQGRDIYADDRNPKLWLKNAGRRVREDRLAHPCSAEK